METATDTTGMNGRQRVQFHYFNPNGAIAQKQITDAKVREAVDAGKCKSGVLFVYGSLNDFHTKAIRGLWNKKRVQAFDIDNPVKHILADIAEAEEFLRGLEMAEA